MTFVNVSVLVLSVLCLASFFSLLFTLHAVIFSMVFDKNIIAAMIVAHMTLMLFMDEKNLKRR